MKVGTLCYATDQGLGILAKSFFDHGVVTDALVVGHAHHATHAEWYPGKTIVPIRRLHSPEMTDRVRGFCAAQDVMLFFETPFDWSLVDFCRSIGVKTIIMPMHECMPRRLPDQPDLWLCPSKLDLEWADKQGSPTGYKQMFLPVEVPWRLRTKAEVFVHNAGHGGLKGRNGTKELLEALQYVKSPAKFIIRSQGGIEYQRKDRLHVELTFGETVPYSELWDEGDVFVFPEKFNGLSLPLQEARAAGMLVMATDRFPMNDWLPGYGACNCGADRTGPSAEAHVSNCSANHTPLIFPSGKQKNRISGAYAEFDEAIIDPKGIAAKIDEWYGRDITEYSQNGAVWAASMSWEALKPQYIKVLENLLRSTQRTRVGQMRSIRH